MRQRQTEGEAGRERERESRDSRQAGRQAGRLGGRQGWQSETGMCRIRPQEGRQAGWLKQAGAIRQGHAVSGRQRQADN
jgi:hypothetical protein